MSQKIAIFTPLPPTKSGISDYSVDLAIALKKLCEVIFVIDDSVPKPNYSDLHGIIYKRLKEFNSSHYKDYVRFYQMGNNIYHEFILKK